MTLSQFEEWITRKLSTVTHVVCRVLATMTVGFLFPLRVSGQKELPETGSVLVIANHQSFLDPVILGLAMPRQGDYVARSGLFRFAPLRWLIMALRAIKIEREGMAKGGLKECLARLELGRVVVVWPEGTRTPDGKVLPIKPGIMLLVRKTAGPIVVAGISGAFESWPRTRWLPWPSPIWVHFSRCHRETEASDSAQLQEKLEAAYRESQLRRARLQGNPK